MNKLTIIGRLTRDVEKMETKTDNTIAVLNVAVSGGSKKDGEYVTDFFRLKAFGKTAEKALNYQKGDMLYIEGTIQNNNYEKDGKKVYQDSYLATWCKRLLVANKSSFELENKESPF
jgi:single-strand DNA-binding protein